MIEPRHGERAQRHEELSLRLSAFALRTLFYRRGAKRGAGVASGVIDPACPPPPGINRARLRSPRPRLRSAHRPASIAGSRPGWFRRDLRRGPVHHLAADRGTTGGCDAHLVGNTGSRWTDSRRSTPSPVLPDARHTPGWRDPPMRGSDRPTCPGIAAPRAAMPATPTGVAEPAGGSTGRTARRGC